MALTKMVESVKTLLTADDLWQMGSQGDNFELVRGELIQMAPPGGIHGSAAVNLGSLLLGFVKQKNLGFVMTETGYKLASHPDTVRGPDISFLSAAKVPAAGLPEGYVDGPPNLAAEIVSPSDTASEIQDKVQDYLAAGTQLVWVVYPQQRLVIVHHPDGTAQTLRETDALSGETVLPGFSCQVADIFG